MRFLLFLICLALPFRAAARSGLVKTLDGRALNGDVEFTNGLFVVDATNSVALTNLSALSFHSPRAPDPSSQGKGQGLLGYYVSNTNFFSSNPGGGAVVRLDESVNFDWDGAEPAPDVPATRFSVAWCGEIEVPETGDYQFAIDADSGATLSLGGKTVIDSRGAPGNSSPPIGLQAGARYPVQLKYFNAGGKARARLFWFGPTIPRSIIPKGRLYPRSLEGHTATIANPAAGLLGTYYTKPDFTGATWTRIDPTVDFEWSNIDPVPGVARTNFSVRWSGQMLADKSELYTFYILADEPARLWLDGKLLMATGGDNFFFERRESISLNAGERHDLRLETQSNGGNATAKLAWSSPSTPKAPVPSSHLFPSKPTFVRNGPVDLTDKTPAGILLRNGSFLAGSIERATESSLHLSGREAPFSTVNIARILLQPLPRQLEDRILPGRAGLLLAKGDFVDAEFKGIENRQVRASSILFGPQTHDAAKVLVVALRNHSLSAYAFEIRLLDGTLLYVSRLDVEGGALIVRDNMAGTMKIAFADLAQIRRAR